MWLILAVAVGTFLTLGIPLLLVPTFGACVIFLLLMNFEPGRSENLRKCFLGPSLRLSVQYKMQKTNEDIPDLDENGQYMFALHPHGLFCFSEMLTFIFDNPFTPLKTLASKTIPLVASELLYIPVLGHLACALGCQTVERSNVLRLLDLKRSIAITPGGVREIKHTNQCSATRLILRKSTKFLDIAKERGISVVPILVQGESDCYSFHRSLRWLQNISIVLLGFPVPVLAFGRWASFWPKKGSNLTLLLGPALDPASFENATDFAARYYDSLDQIAAANGITLYYVDRSGNPIGSALDPSGDLKERSES